MKKTFASALMLITILFATVVPAHAAAPDYKSPAKPIKVFVEGEEKPLTLPILENKGRTLYPFKQLMQLLGAKVDWDEVKKEASATKNDTTVAFVIGKDSYSVNGETKKMETAAVVDKASSSTYIPIRYAAEALGYTVDWLVCGESNELWVSKEYKFTRDDAKLMIDGKLIEFPKDVLPISHGPLYVPLDYTIKWMGGNVIYDKKTQMITVKKGSTVFKIKVGSVDIVKGGNTWLSDHETISKNGVIYISVINLASGIDKNYRFDIDTDTLVVEDKKTVYAKVFLDDKEIIFPDNIKPYVAYDETYMPVLLPVEFITQYLGGKSKWDAKSHVLEITYKGHLITQKIDSYAAYVDGNKVSTSNRIIVKNGIVYMAAIDYTFVVFQKSENKNFEAIREDEFTVVIYTKDYFEKTKGSEREW